jgi:hypothetical protein
MSRKKYIKNINIFKVVASKWILEILMFCLFLAVSKALGIEAASFASFFGQRTTDNRQRTTGIFE